MKSRVNAYIFYFSILSFVPFLGSRGFGYDRHRQKLSRLRRFGITINSTLDTVFNSGNVASVINSGYLKTNSASIRNIESSIDKKYTG